ncbi:transcriptional regulator with XRE-family HTH domain [Paenibacillus sp. LBL]|uniref:helix-turn-helix domain-containing protein n=1 Tax=Paenibacillus sp. LBL TaxID=2940563 RepID=UPI002472E8BF|nr:helix-turn-helix transcriptional regulator [Paenibacillus sp. LBL]MDH6674259.1 transcriptional regulator with XRE-family HTH domain [Paenibacillus sp. LBL]
MLTPEKHLHEKIVKARRAKGYTQKEVAYKMNMTLNEVRQFEKIEKDMSDVGLESIAEIIGLSPEGLKKEWRRVYKKQN